MAEYIEREAVMEEIDEMISNIAFTSPYEDEIHIMTDGMERAKDCVYDAPAADVVEVDRVALMLKESFGDSCACNYNGNDEWLPLVCDFQDECPYPPGVLDCWKQFVKHFGERKEG